MITCLQHFIYIFGVPSRIVSDKGSAFTSHTMKRFCEAQGIKHVQNAVATPRANGQCERYNRTVLESLRCLIVNDKDETYWDTHVKEIQFSLNTTVNATTGETPYKVLMGTNPKHWSDAYIVSTLMNELPRENLTELRSRVTTSIERAQAKSKERFDLKRARPRRFTEGELVLVRKTNQVVTGSSRKLDPVFKGPFRVMKRLPNDRYLVEDQRDTRKYVTVIADQDLKPWVVLTAAQDQPFE